MQKNRFASQNFAVLVTAALVVIAGLSASGRDGRHSVPEDDSLPVAQYLKQGIADPAISWTEAQYRDALAKLAAMPPGQLPRFQSERSGLMFERLLITNLEVSDFALPSGVATIRTPYGVSRGDGLFFDRELVAIRGAVLKNYVSGAPTKEDVQVAERDTSTLYENAKTADERERRAESLRVYSELLGQLSPILRQHVQSLLYLLSLKELTANAREDVTTELRPLAPLLRSRMVDGDVEALAAELSGLSRLESNQAISDELASMARSVKTGSAS